MHTYPERSEIRFNEARHKSERLEPEMLERFALRLKRLHQVEEVTHMLGRLHQVGEGTTLAE